MKKILLIEDRVSHSAFFKEALEGHACEIVVAETVAKLRSVMKAHPFGPWDLIVMDCQIPERPGALASTDHMEEVYGAIWPLVQHDSLWIWTVYEDNSRVLQFLRDRDLLRFTIPKAQTPERLKQALLRALRLEGGTS